MKKFNEFINENKDEDENPTFSYNELSEKSKDNAKWEVQQRNKVAKHQNIPGEELTIHNSLFYSNGVYAGRKKTMDVDFNYSWDSIFGDIESDIEQMPQDEVNSYLQSIIDFCQEKMN